MHLIVGSTLENKQLGDDRAWKVPGGHHLTLKNCEHTSSQATNSRPNYQLVRRRYAETRESVILEL